MLRAAIGLALGTALMAGLARAESSPAAPLPYSIDRATLVAGAPLTAVAPGTVRRIMPGDAIFEAPIVWQKRGQLRAPLTVTITGLEFQIAQSQSLMAATATGGDLAGLRADAPILCTHDYPDLRDKAVTPANPKSRYEKWSVLCLVDSDADGLMDKAFTDGSKLPADWHMIDIPATAYDIAEMVPHESGDVIKVVYAKGLMFRPSASRPSHGRTASMRASPGRR